MDGPPGIMIKNKSRKLAVDYMNLEPEVQSPEMSWLAKSVKHLNVQCPQCALVVIKEVGDYTIFVEPRVLDSAHEVITRCARTDYTKAALCVSIVADAVTGNLLDAQDEVIIVDHLMPML